MEQLGAAMEYLNSRRTRNCRRDAPFFCSCSSRIRRCLSAIVPPLELIVRFQLSSEHFSFTMVFTAIYSTKYKFYPNYCCTRLTITFNCSLIYFLLAIINLDEK
jgi:hypothetical protein